MNWLNNQFKYIMEKRVNHKQFEPFKDDVEFDGNSIKLTDEREKELIRKISKNIDKEQTMELKLNELEVRKLNPQPGETLLFTIKSDSVDTEDIQRLSDGLKAFFPNNRVAVLSVGAHEDIQLTITQESTTLEEKGE